MSPGRPLPPRLGVVAGSAPATGVALAVLVAAAVAVDAFRVGFFADDLHFLDVARRTTLLESVRGAHGIWPWYRPLSREVFFEALVAFGPAASAVGHAIAAACLLLAGLAVARVGAPLVGSGAAAIGAVLFVTHGFSKFLVAWASGFQDVLAVTLTLGAIAADQGRGRGVWPLAALAPLAKETGFLVFPLLAARRLWSGEGQSAAGAPAAPGGGRRWWLGFGASAAAATAIHVAARATWPPQRRAPLPETDVGGVAGAIGQAVAGFVATPGALGAMSVALAAVAAAAAWWVLRAAHRTGLAAPGATRGEAGAHARAARHGARRAAVVGTAAAPSGLPFLAAAAALGLAPLVVGPPLGLTAAHAYYAFPALPWLALLAGRALAGLAVPVRTGVVVALVAWNVAALGYRAVDLSAPDAWSFRRWDWREAVRLSAVTERLSDDVRRELASRPDSMVALYDGLPTGCYFQTEDGPATREALGDATARAYWINDPADDVRGDRMAVLTFSTSDYRLHRHPWTRGDALQQSIRAIIAERPALARAFATFRQREDARSFDGAYLRAAADLLDDGPEAFVRGLAAAGVADTAGPDPAAVAAAMTAVRPAVGLALEAMLRSPRSAERHVALAETLVGQGAPPRAALELRLAVRLDPARVADRYRLAELMRSLGGDVEAMRELRALERDPRAASLREPVQRSIAAILAGGRSPRR